MSDLAAPVIENVEVAAEEVPRIAQRRASAKAREDDRKVTHFFSSFICIDGIISIRG